VSGEGFAAIPAVVGEREHRSVFAAVAVGVDALEA